MQSELAFLKGSITQPDDILLYIKSKTSFSISTIVFEKNQFPYYSRMHSLCLHLPHDQRIYSFLSRYVGQKNSQNNFITNGCHEIGVTSIVIIPLKQSKYTLSIPSIPPVYAERESIYHPTNNLL